MDNVLHSIALLCLNLCFLTLNAQESKKPVNVSLDIVSHKTDSGRTSNVNIGILGNVEKMHGVQVNSFSSIARKDMRGLQVAGISNVVSRANGVQMAGLTNIATEPFRGLQLSGITNIAMGVKRGIQFSGIANVCSSTMRGLQMANYNYADTLNGSQIGLVNICVSHPRGVQVGIINYSRDTIAHKIGLVNVNPKTRIDLLLFGGSSTKVNVGVRFRNRSTYNIIGFGTHYMGLDEKFSGALYYRIGQYFALSPRWSVGGDVGYFHVETFQENSDTKPERLYSLQARLNIDYRFTPNLGTFATIGVGDTRYYYHSHRYRTRMIVEAGLAVNINRRNAR